MATKKQPAVTAGSNAGIPQVVARDLDALRRVDPGQWRDKILAAFREKKGNAVQAANVLGIGHRTLLRYMEQDSTLKVAIDKARGVAGKEREAEKKREAAEKREGARIARELKASRPKAKARGKRDADAMA